MGVVPKGARHNLARHLEHSLPVDAYCSLRQGWHVGKQTTSWHTKPYLFGDVVELFLAAALPQKLPLESLIPSLLELHIYLFFCRAVSFRVPSLLWRECVSKVSWFLADCSPLHTLPVHPHCTTVVLKKWTPQALRRRVMYYF